MDAARSKSSTAAVMLTLAATVVVLAGVRAAQPIMVPFLLSVFIAVISAPALLWLEEHGLPRAVAMLAVVAGIIVMALGMTVLVGTSIRDFTGNLPVYKQRLNDQFGASVMEFLRDRGLEVNRADVLGVLDPGAAIQVAGDIFNSFGSVLANAFLIFMTVVFILFETATFPEKLRAIAANPEHSIARFVHFTENLRNYLAIKTIASLGTGFVIGLWLWILGVDYPVLWGMLAFPAQLRTQHRLHHCRSAGGAARFGAGGPCDGWRRSTGFRSR